MQSCRELLHAHFCWTRWSGHGGLGLARGLLDHHTGAVAASMVELGRAGGVKNISIAVSLSSPVASNCKLLLGKDRLFLCTLSCFLSYFQHWFTSCSLFTVPLNSPLLVPSKLDAVRILCPARTFPWEISLSQVPEPALCKGRGYIVTFICHRSAGLVALVCSCLPAHSHQG